MKLLLVTGTAPQSAPPVYDWIRLRARGYAESGHEVRLIAPPAKGASATEEYEMDGFRVDRASPENAVNLAKEFSPDRLLIHHVSEWSMAVTNQLPVPKVFWIYGPEVLYPSDYYDKPGVFTRFCLNFLDRARTKKMRKELLAGGKFVCTSKYAAEKLVEFLPGKTGDVIYGPVEPHPPRPETGGKSFRGLAIEHLGHRTLVSSGIDLLIEAYRDLKETTLTLAGSGGAVEDLRRWIARERSSIELKVLEPGEDPGSLLAEHDYFVVAGRFHRELFRACQAMACGLPVLAPAAWAFPEIVVKGETGYGFGAGNPADLRKGIAFVLAKYPSVAKGAGAWAEKNCDFKEAIQRELDEVYTLGYPEERRNHD